MRVLFDFFINIARWAWLKSGFFHHQKIFVKKICRLNSIQNTEIMGEIRL